MAMTLNEGISTAYEAFAKHILLTQEKLLAETRPPCGFDPAKCAAHKFMPQVPKPIIAAKQPAPKIFTQAKKKKHSYAFPVTLVAASALSLTTVWYHKETIAQISQDGCAIDFNGNVSSQINREYKRWFGTKNALGTVSLRSPESVLNVRRCPNTLQDEMFTLSFKTIVHFNQESFANQNGFIAIEVSEPNGQKRTGYVAQQYIEPMLGRNR